MNAWDLMAANQEMKRLAHESGALIQNEFRIAPSGKALQVAVIDETLDTYGKVCMLDRMTNTVEWFSLPDVTSWPRQNNQHNITLPVAATSGHSTEAPSPSGS